MSILADQFDAVAKFGHATGSLFITRISDGTSPKYRTMFRSLYSLYAMLLVGGCTIYEILLLHFKVAGYKSSATFSNTVFSTLLVIIAIRIAANVSITLSLSGKLADVLNHAEDFEASLPVESGLQKKNRNFIDLLRRLLMVLSFAAFTLSRYLFFGELTSERLSSIAKMASSAFVIVSTVVLSSACHFVHAIATLVYRVFTDDLGYLFAVAKARLSPGSMLWSPRTARVLEDTRLKYLAMRKIVQELNDVLQYSTFVTVTCTLLTLCTCAYLISETESSWGKLVFTASYAVSSSVELFHITVSVSQLKEQIAEIGPSSVWWASQLSLLLEAPQISQLPKSVVQQVQLFKESLDIQLFCASGLGFFTVDKPLLVSTGACVMSYTILLVQTGDGYQSKHELAP